MFDLKGRVAVISGASSGLGKQMALGFAKAGADVVLVARRIERLEELKSRVEELGVKALAVKCHLVLYLPRSSCSCDMLHICLLLLNTYLFHFLA